MKQFLMILAIVAVTSISAKHHKHTGPPKKVPAHWQLADASMKMMMTTAYETKEKVKYEDIVDRLHDLVPVMNFTDVKIAAYKMTCVSRNCERDTAVCYNYIDPDTSLEYQRRCMNRALKAIPRDGCCSIEMTACVLENLGAPYGEVFNPDDVEGSVKNIMTKHFEAKVPAGSGRDALISGLNDVCVLPTENVMDQMMNLGKCLMDVCMYEMAARIPMTLS